MVGAMYTSYNVVSGAYKQVTDKAKISSSSRDLVTMIMRDIRMAGFKYYSGTHAQERFRTLMEDRCPSLSLPDRNYIVFNSGFSDDEINRSHAPLVIRKNVTKTFPELHNSQDLCCDRIEIVYEDFRLLENSDEDLLQPFKIYKISYFARQRGTQDDDPRYAVFKKIESWNQPRGIDDCRWPADEADLAIGFWDTTCPECFDETMVRDHIVDMEFIPFDENGKIIMDDSLNFPSPENMNLRDRLFDIRTVDMRLTFRSKNPFYEKDMARDPNDSTNSIKRKVYGLQRIYEPDDSNLDKYLRDSVIVTINTRNIGQEFQ